MDESKTLDILEAYFGRPVTELEHLRRMAYTAIHNWYYVGLAPASLRGALWRAGRSVKIYVIRHGETEANVAGILEGRTDGRLTDAGRALAHEVGHAMSGIAFDAAYSSPLSRALGTAQAVLSASGNPDTPIFLDQRLLEVDMGAWEGLRFLPGEREVDAEECRQFFEEPFVFPGFPGGETIREVCSRTQAFLRELMAGTRYSRVLVSTHGCALRAMLNVLYDDPSDFWQSGVPLNCSVSLIEVTDGNARLCERDAVLYDSSKCVDRYASY